jgi:hypothetical protein
VQLWAAGKYRLLSEGGLHVRRHGRAGLLRRLGDGHQGPEHLRGQEHGAGLVELPQLPHADLWLRIRRGGPHREPEHGQAGDRAHREVPQRRCVGEVCVGGGRDSPPTPQPPPWPPRPSLPRAGPPPSSTPLFPITPSPLYRPPSPLLSRPFRGAGRAGCQGRGYNAVLWTSYNPAVTRTVKAIEQGTGLFVINVPADFVTGSVVQGAGVSVGRYCHRCRCCVGGGYRKQIVSKVGGAEKTQSV